MSAPDFWTAPPLTIRAMYSCDKCGLKKIQIDVPARGAEDVVVWMKNLSALLSRDHDRRSPTCSIHELTEVYIPVTGATKIGGPTVQ